MSEIRSQFGPETIRAYVGSLKESDANMTGIDPDSHETVRQLGDPLRQRCVGQWAINTAIRRARKWKATSSGGPVIEVFDRVVPIRDEEDKQLLLKVTLDASDPGQIVWLQNNHEVLEQKRGEEVLRVLDRMTRAK